MQRLQNNLIPLYQFRSCETNRNPRLLGMVFNQMNDPMNTPMYRPAMVFLITEIHPPRALLILGNMYGMGNQFIYAFIFSS